MRGGWTGVALGAASGFLAGVLVVALLGPGTKTITRTVTAPEASGSQSTGRVITSTLVPNLIGTRLDVAKQRVQRAGFDVRVSGGGVLGVLRDQNWQVVGQDPPAGNQLEQGSTVTLDIERG